MRRRLVIGLIATLLSPAFLVGGENGALTLAGQTYLYDHDGNEATPPVERAQFDPAAPEDGNLYLRFLRDHLSYDPRDIVYTRADAYPVVAVMDNGIDNGGRSDRIELPDSFPVERPGHPVVPVKIRTQDFYELGRVENPSRMIFSFFYRYRESNFQSPWIPGQPSTYPRDFVEFRAENDGSPIFSHGHGVASMLAGYNGRVGEVNREQTTQLAYGLGVNPYGRFGNARFVYDEVRPTEDRDGVLEPLDFYWIIDRSWRAVETVDGEPPHLLIANGSFGFEAPRPGENLLDPMTNPTGARYDFHPRMFDALTRNATDDVTIHPGQAPRPTLFVMGTGQFGQEYYGNGWEDYLDGGTPERSLWQGAEDYILGFHVPRVNTISAPGVAKNVLSVGASDVFEVRPLEVCPGGELPPLIRRAERVGAFEDAQNIPGYTPRGMDASLGEFRIKPDVVAPSSGSYANVWTRGIEHFEQCFAGSYNDATSPYDGTTTYIRGGGTSGATPMIAGFAQLADLHLRKAYFVERPTPALVKAWVIHSGQMLRGKYSGKLDPNYPAAPPGYDPPEPPVEPTFQTHKFPSPYQGFGRPDLSMALDRTPRLVVNQEVVLGEDDVYTWEGFVADSTKPVRLTLAWTDAVDFTGAEGELWEDLINDLDLEVVITEPSTGVRTYLGNRFSEELLDISQPFAEEEALPTPDRVNNVECIFLEPHTIFTRISVRVSAANLRGDGLNPWQVGSTERRQDFALVGYNMVESFENGDCATASTELEAPWGSSVELSHFGFNAARWHRIGPFQEVTNIGTTLESTAPVFRPGNAIEWSGEGSATLVSDPDRGEVMSIVGTMQSGARTEAELPGWGIPAWNLEGKSQLSFAAKTDSEGALLRWHVESVEGNIATVLMPLAPGDWRVYTRNLQAASGTRFLRVIGVTVEGAEGVLLDSVELSHPYTVDVYTGSQCGVLGISPIAQPGESAWIRVTGNASQGGYRLTVKENAAEESWRIF